MPKHFYSFPATGWRNEPCGCKGVSETHYSAPLVTSQRRIFRHFLEKQNWQKYHVDVLLLGSSSSEARNNTSGRKRRRQSKRCSEATGNQRQTPTAWYQDNVQGNQHLFCHRFHSKMSWLAYTKQNIVVIQTAATLLFFKFIFDLS